MPMTTWGRSSPNYRHTVDDGRHRADAFAKITMAPVPSSSLFLGNYRGCDDASCGAGEARHAEMHVGASGRDLVHVGQFLSGSSEAHLQSFDVTVPAVLVGFFDSRSEVGFDLNEA